MNPHRIEDDALHVVLHAWIATYLPARGLSGTRQIRLYSTDFANQSTRLRESALQLQAALERMRLANERLAARMAEHKAFFAKYQSPE